MTKTILRDNRISLTTFMVIILISLLYMKFARPVYKISGSATIIRPSLPPVTNLTPETRNRWVWVRDGLSLREIIQQDRVFVEMVDSSEILRGRLDKYLEENVNHDKEDLTLNFVRNLKKNIDIDYTGGDSNLYTFSIRETDPFLGKTVIAFLISKLKKLHQEMLFSRNKSNLNEMLAQVKTMESAKKDARLSLANGANVHILNLLNDAYGKLFVENLMQDIQTESSFKIINEPFVPLAPFWPKIEFILLAALLAGLFFGGLLQYVVKRTRTVLES